MPSNTSALARALDPFRAVRSVFSNERNHTIHPAAHGNSVAGLHGSAPVQIEGEISHLRLRDGNRDGSRRGHCRCAVAVQMTPTAIAAKRIAPRMVMTSHLRRQGVLRGRAKKRVPMTFEAREPDRDNAEHIEKVARNTAADSDSVKIEPVSSVAPWSRHRGGEIAELPGTIWASMRLHGRLRCSRYARSGRLEHALFSGNHCRSNSDNRCRLPVRRVDIRAFQRCGAGRCPAAADGELGRRQRELA
jgi:hypothetical protein